MTCKCGQADECDGEYGVHYPVTNGGTVAVIPCEDNNKQQEYWIDEQGNYKGN